MIYVELKKNFLLADSNELMVVRLISASWAKKPLIPTFLTWCTSSWWKIFFSPIRTSWWLLDSFRPPEPKNVWFLLSRHDVRRVEKKFSSRRFGRTFGCYTHFGLLSPKTLILSFWTRCTSSAWKIFFSPIRASWWLLDSFRPSEPKNVDFFFLDKVYVECMKNFLLADSSELMAVRLISASWAQKRLIFSF